MIVSSSVRLPVSCLRVSQHSFLNILAPDGRLDSQPYECCSFVNSPMFHWWMFQMVPTSSARIDHIIWLVSTPAQSIEEKKQRLLALAKRKRDEVAATAKSRLERTWHRIWGSGHQWNNHPNTQRWLLDLPWNLSGGVLAKNFLIETNMIHFRTSTSQSRFYRSFWLTVTLPSLPSSVLKSQACKSQVSWRERWGQALWLHGLLFFLTPVPQCQDSDQMEDYMVSARKQKEQKCSQSIASWFAIEIIELLSRWYCDVISCYL